MDEQERERDPTDEVLTEAFRVLDLLDNAMAAYPQFEHLLMNMTFDGHLRIRAVRKMVLYERNRRRVANRRIHAEQGEKPIQ